MRAIDLPKDVLAAIAMEIERGYPDEACGLVLEDEERRLRFLPVPNIAGSPGGKATSTRTRRDGYVMDPKVLLPALEATERQGGRLAAIVHSHPDVGAYFSREDRDMALGGKDEPLWAGVDYLVVSCRAGKIDDARLYRWNPRAREFDEEQVAGIVDV